MIGRQQRRAQILGAGGAGGATIVAAALTRAALGSWPGLAPVEVAQGLGFVATGAAALLAWWVALVLVSAVGSLLRAGAWEATGTDRLPLARRVATWLLAAAAVSLTSTSAVAAPAVQPVAVQSFASQPVVVGANRVPVAASAHPETGHVAIGDLGTGHPQTGPSGEEAQLPEPGWTPTPSSVPHPTEPAGDVGLVSTPARTAAAQDEQAHVVVHAGDTLWGIAARHLGPQSTDEDVARAWPLWYAANVEVIGADPDLILPGQLLVVPSGAGS